MERIPDRLRGHLEVLYPEDVAETTLRRLLSSMERFRESHPQIANQRPALFDETDVWLIAYADHVTSSAPPLVTLERFLVRHFAGFIGGVHLLPHYPWTSDDGFAVVDYDQVDPRLGDWTDVERLAASFRLMLDAVVNHTSSASPWFLGWLQDDPEFADFFISLPPETDLDQVVRPRTTPLLTPFAARDGLRHVWTTFGPDQVDLNYANPEVLLRVTEVLLGYVARGADALRLDAIAFLWKRVGTTCIHLGETHEVIRLWRTVLDAVAPGTLIVTETNVPHAENLSYLGDGTDEAHLVYQFPLPPLVLHAFRRGDAVILQRWMDTLPAPSDSTTFLNFLSSHDGIGLRPVERLIPDGEIEALGEAIEAEGGGVTYRSIGGRAPFPYELNVSYFDALNPPGSSSSASQRIDRFVAAHSLLLSLAGIPAVYLHSLLGSRNWYAGVEQTGHLRSINREKLALVELEAELAEPDSHRAQVCRRLMTRIAARVAEPAFHPAGPQRRVRTDPSLVAFERHAVDGATTVLCIHNVTDQPQRFQATPSDGLSVAGPLLEICTGRLLTADERTGLDVPMGAYEVLWLRAPG